MRPGMEGPPPGVYLARMAKTADSFRTRGALAVEGSEFVIYRLGALGTRAARLPLSLKVLLENLLRRGGGRTVTPDQIQTPPAWGPQAPPQREGPLLPARVPLPGLTRGAPRR